MSFWLELTLKKVLSLHQLELVCVVANRVIAHAHSCNRIITEEGMENLMSELQEFVMDDFALCILVKVFWEIPWAGRDFSSL